MLSKEEVYVKDNYYSNTREELSKKLGKTPYQIRMIVSKLVSCGILEHKSASTKSRISPEKIEYLINNYSEQTKDQLAENLGESTRWVKRQIKKLLKEKRIKSKRGKIRENTGSEFWTEDLKNYIFSLRIDKLMSSKDISTRLKKEKNIDVPPHTVEYFLIHKNKVSMPTKKEWLELKLGKEGAINLIEEGYRLVDISKYLLDLHGVYISDDLILEYFKDINIDSQKNYRIKEVRKKSLNFNKEWLIDRINKNCSIKDISNEMGVSKIIVCKRIKEEGLKLRKHRIVWDYNLEDMRNNLSKVEGLKKYLSREDEHQMILGWFLGDGSLDRNGRLVIYHSIKQLGYLYVKYKVLKRYVSSIFTVPPKSTLINGVYVYSEGQIGFSCVGMKRYLGYLNRDGTKNYEKILKDIKPLGFSCYFMDDGSFFSGKKVMSIRESLIDKYENTSFFGSKITSSCLEVKSVDNNYILPMFSRKVRGENVGYFWRSLIPELDGEIDINNLLDLSLVSLDNADSNENILNKVTEFYQNTHGFPFYSVSLYFLKKELDHIKNLDTSYLWKDINILRSVHVGDSIFKHKMKNIVDSKFMGISPNEAFNNYAILRTNLQKCLEKNNSVMPSILYNYLMFSFRAVSGFPCGIAKAIVERFSKEGDLVVDPCAGWGGRLIGSVSSDRKYFGFEPWYETSRNLVEINNFIEGKNTTIVNSNFSVADAPKKCDFIFTSPPYGDYEEYGKKITMMEWDKLVNDIFIYSEKFLKNGGYLVLNVPEYLKNRFPSTSLIEESPIYWFSSSKKRSKKKAEKLFVWKKT